MLLPPVSLPGHGFPCTMVWTDPSGAHLMATCGISGIVNGTRYTRANLHLPDTSGITLSWPGSSARASARDGNVAGSAARMQWRRVRAG